MSNMRNYYPHTSTTVSGLATPDFDEGDAAAGSETVPGTAALVKGISVIRAISRADRAPTMSRLADATRLPKGTLHRMLKALTTEGLVRYRSDDRTYHLGFELLSLACQALDELDVRDIARDELARLRDLTGEAAHLAIHDDLRAVYVSVVESGLAVGPIAKIGSSSDLHSSAVGKAIAAFLPPAERSATLRRLPMTQHTGRTITSRRALAAHLDDIARQGFALNEEEESLGIHGIGAPVFDHQGTVVASVCTTIPSYRYDPSALPSNAAAVMDAAAAVSRRMGYRNPAKIQPRRV